MVKHLFLGGPWHGRVEEVDPGWAGYTVEVPSVHVNPRDPFDITVSATTYTARRFVLRSPSFQHGPSRTWLVYVVGPEPDPEIVVGLLCRLAVEPEEVVP